MKVLSPEDFHIKAISYQNQLGKIIMKQNIFMQIFSRQAPWFLMAMLAIGIGSMPIGHAATFSVNNPSDTVDVIPGDGLCFTADSACTLRAAIQEANALTGSDTINLPAGTYVLGIAGMGENSAAIGDLDIIDDLSIMGVGMDNTIIDAGKVDRVFDILASANVTITKVTVRNGDLGFGGASGEAGGGIRNAGTLALSDLILTGNTAGIEFGSGGGMLNTGTLDLTNVTVSANSAFFTGGLANLGNATLTDVTISGNTAIDATAGIDNSLGGIATLINVTISGNTGGGSTTSGGGIGNCGTATLTNVTISGNTGQAGGGIYIPYALPNPSPVTQLKNTIVANNSGKNCSATLYPIVSLGHNLDSDNSCSLIGANDLVNIDPLLGPLQNNGGTTFTHALLEGSPAIDAGNPDCPPPTTDQRGVTRPQGITCDIGAFEAPPLAPFAAFDVRMLLITEQKDSFFVTGYFTLGGTSNGIDPVAEPVVFFLADTDGKFFEQMLLPGSFEPFGENSFLFRALKENSGIRFMIIRPTGNAEMFTFEVLGKNLDLNEANNPPVTVSLHVGNKVGSEMSSCKNLANVLICR